MKAQVTVHDPAGSPLTVSPAAHMSGMPLWHERQRLQLDLQAALDLAQPEMRLVTAQAIERIQAELDEVERHVQLAQEVT
jgi:hypothetical protein